MHQIAYKIWPGLGAHYNKVTPYKKGGFQYETWIFESVTFKVFQVVESWGYHVQRDFYGKE